MKDRYSITFTEYYYPDTPEQLARVTLAVIDLRTDNLVETKEFWADPEIDIVKFDEAAVQILKKYRDLGVTVHSMEHPVPLEKCPCADKGCSEYLTNVMTSKDIKRFNRAKRRGLV